MQRGNSDRVTPSDDAFLRMRRESISDDIAKRLRNVCSHFSEAEFKKLVEAMTDQKLKGERSRTV